MPMPMFVHLLDDERVDVGVDGVAPRRHEHACPVRAHLMHVVDDLRPPNVVHFLDHQPRFLLAEDVPVAVVVVSDVLLVKLDHRGAFVGRSEIALVPASNLVHTVGIQRWNE